MAVDADFDPIELLKPGHRFALPFIDKYRSDINLLEQARTNIEEVLAGYDEDDPRAKEVRAKLNKLKASISHLTELLESYEKENQ